MSEIASRVKAIIVDKLGVEESEVTTEASFTNDLGADSLDTVELIMEFEKEFGISIPDDQDVYKRQGQAFLIFIEIRQMFPDTLHHRFCIQMFTHDSVSITNFR